jgi:hypothetical protein
LKRAAIFGAGIAGLTIAHELIQRGYKVSVYEALPEAGGFFRSARLKHHQCMPSEYSWHGFGPWYHNVFDIMKHIPFDDAGSLYDKALSRPIDYGVFPDSGQAAFYDKGLGSIPAMFRLTRWDFIKWSWLMLKTWSADRRTELVYSTLNAAEQWKSLLSIRGYTTWRATFGPWIGSDWTKVSLHHAGQFFRKQLMTKPAHFHKADEDGPAWRHGAGDGWLLLRGPSSEFWFDKWVKHLQREGVEFYWKESLMKLEYDGKIISSALLQSGKEIEANFYFLAINPFSAAEIISRTPPLEDERELRLFKSLTQEGPHTQVSFRIAFSEPISFPRQRTAVVVADSEYNLTLFAEEQVWEDEVELGENIKSLWTGTSCAGNVAGGIYNLPVVKCTEAQFVEEIKAQILRCGSLNTMLKEANNGRGFADFAIYKIEIWHEWRFSPEGIIHHQPKWVTTSRTQRFLPDQATSISNLLLAGAHTRTAVDVWSIEGAVESGRKAVQRLEPDVTVIPQYKPSWLRFMNILDNLCFDMGLPNIVDLLLPLLIVLILLAGLMKIF